MFNRIVYLLIAVFLIGLGVNIAMGYTWYNRIYATTFSFGEQKEIIGVLFSLCSLPFFYCALRPRENINKENNNE